MQKYLDDLSIEAGVAPEWKELLRDLDRLQQVRLQYRGADWLVRTDAAPTITTLFRQAHVALPPRARQTAPPKPTALLLEKAREGLGCGVDQFPNRDRPKASPFASPLQPLDHVFLRGQLHQKIVGRSPPAQHSANRFYRHRRPDDPSSFFWTSMIASARSSRFVRSRLSRCN
jgi:hypothetical protein